ncbi:MAG: prolipoprotein diacylglyceryl transferase [Robiginitomaculum sp.]|nr:MAG: prolipoprotein diacylglyceryl transferase [Robiginitomaculum sp.]
MMRAIHFPPWIKDEIFHIGPISVKWYGVSYIIGLFLAYYYAKRTCARTDIWVPKTDGGTPSLIPNGRMLEDYMFYCLLGIIIGGRIGSILLYNTADYISDPIRIFKVWEGGMAFHGGFLGVVVAAIYMSRSRKIAQARIADLAAISAPIGIGLVRIANFINQELYGRVTDVSWAFIFDTSPYPRHPSQLYESFLEGFVIFIVLFIGARKFKTLTKPGLSTGMFLVMYGAFRIFVENFREPDVGIAQFGFLTRGMMYSLPMVIIGLIVIMWALKRPAVAVLRPTEEVPT